MLAIAVRAIAPTGYMVGRSDDGLIAVRLCTDHGFQSATLDPKSGAIVLDSDRPSKNPDQQNPKKPPLCPFAGQPAPLTAAAPLQIDAPQRVAIEIGKIAKAEQRARTWAERPWPTGPPLNS